MRIRKKIDNELIFDESKKGIVEIIRINNNKIYINYRNEKNINELKIVSFDRNYEVEINLKEDEADN